MLICLQSTLSGLVAGKPNYHVRVVTAVKALADSAIAQADTKALYSTKLQLRNFAKKAEVRLLSLPPLHCGCLVVFSCRPFLLFATLLCLTVTNLNGRHAFNLFKEIYGNTPTYQLLMETLSTVTESEQKQLASR